LRGFSFHLRIQKFFISKLIFDIYIKSWNSRDVWHKLANYSGVSLPLFFSFSDVILPEKFVWSEDWKFNFSHGTPWTATAYNIMRKSINNTGATWLEVTIPFVNFWPNTKETNETSFFEVNQVFSVGSSSFSMNHNWIPHGVNFRLLLSVYDLFNQSNLVVFWGSIKMQVLRGNRNWTDTWDVFNFLFSNNAWVLLKSV